MQERKEQKTRPFSLLVTTEKDFVIKDMTRDIFI
jgi:hypothetical protein